MKFATTVALFAIIAYTETMAQPYFPSTPQPAAPPPATQQPAAPGAQPQQYQPIPLQPPNPNQPAIPNPANSQQSPPLTPPQSGAMTQESKSKRFADRPAVTIREFRSSVTEVAPRAATDMFMTALVATRKFRVLERLRLTEGIGQEKLLNQQGATGGQSGEVKYVGAKYMFEGTVSEAQIDQNTTSMGLNVLGVGGKKSYSSDSIGIDVRVIEVESGIVADAIKIRKPIYGEATEVGGIGDALTNIVSQRFLGGAVQAAGSKEYESKRKDSIDVVLRQCIDAAVKEIAERFADE